MLLKSAMKSAIVNFGIGVIFPDMISQAGAILKSLEEKPGERVYILHYEQRILSAREAFLVHQNVNLLKLSMVGGGHDPDSLEKGLKIFSERIKQYQKEEVGLIAFDNVSNLQSSLIMSIVHEATMAIQAMERTAIGDFDCMTGKKAKDFEQLFSLASWDKIEQKAREYAGLSC